MKLVPDWRSAWKWHSTHFMALAASFPLIWAQLPEDAKAMIPVAWEPWIPSLLLIAGFIGRLRDQE